MPLELEIEVKVQKPLVEEDVEDLEAKRIIGKQPMIDVINLNDESKFEYRRLTIDIEDIDCKGDFDGQHTVLYFPYGMFLVRMSYDKFMHIYETMTGRTVKKLSDFKFTTKRQ